MSVSNAIWDKPGRLDAGEWDQVRAHPRFTERVLQAAAPWRDLVGARAADQSTKRGALKY